MSFYYSCQECGGPLDKPSAAFDLNEYGFARRCPHCQKDPGQFQTLEQWVIDIDRRLQEVEALLVMK